MHGVFRTKRLGYHKALELISQTNALAIIGQRYIGKTTILLQIKELYGEHALYVDLSEYNDRESLNGIFDLCTDDTDLILLDEVTKYEVNHVAAFVKNALIHQMKCIYTGSNPHMLRKYSDVIGRGLNLELSTISYGEWLCWKHGDEINDISTYTLNALKYSTNRQFIQFLNEPTESELLKRLTNSMNNIIKEDKQELYDNRYATSFEEDLNNRQVLNFLTYLAVNTLVLATYNNGSIQTISKLHSNLNSLKDISILLKEVKQNLEHTKKSELNELMSLAIRAGIIRTGKVFGADDNNLYIVSIAKLVIVLLKMISENLGINLNDEIKVTTSTRDSLLIENLFLYYLSFIELFEVGKYRDKYEQEFDIAYNNISNTKLHVSEVKNITYDELFKRNYTTKYEKCANNIQADFEVLTYACHKEDTTYDINTIRDDFYNYKVIPNHVLAILLEKPMLEGWFNKYGNTLSEIIKNSIDEVIGSPILTNLPSLDFN